MQQDNIQIHERLTSVETHLENQGIILIEIKDRLLEDGGIVDTVKKHKIYWKIVGVTGRVLLYAGTPTAIAAVAYALRS